MDTLSDGSLPCFRCGTVAPPLVEPGTGPHAAKAVCSGCRTFLKWLPRRKEPRMHPSVNRVLLIGRIGKQGVTVSYLTTGTAKASYTLEVTERRGEKSFPLYLACEVYGKGAEAAGECEAGQLVVCDGKLGMRKSGEKWEMVVQSFELKPVVGILTPLEQKG